MKNKIFYGLGLLTISTFGFVVNANALDVTKDFTLTEDVKDGIVVKAGSNVKINLAGFNVSNEKGDHTIKIEKGATAVITGEGIVTNNTNKKAPVFNDGTVTIESGTYKRVDAKDNTFYVLLNHGKMTIDGGKYALENGISSLIDNGWYTPSENTSKEYATLTINDGTFEMTANDKYIKNDDYGKMIVNGGTFNMHKPSSAVIANVGSVGGEESLIVNNGTFNYYGTASDRKPGYAIWDYNWGTQDKSVTTVNGGKFNLHGTQVAGITNATLAENKKEYKVLGSDEYIMVKEDELVNTPQVDTMKEDAIAKEDKALIDKVVTDKKYNVAGYYDIDLFKATSNGLKVEQLTEVEGGVSIKLQLPSTLASVKKGFKRTYYVIRLHDGVTTVLPAVDNGDRTITFKSDKFSTYTLVYNDSEIKKVTNPETSDNVLIYFAVATISLAGLAVSGIALKKRFN